MARPRDPEIDRRTTAAARAILTEQGYEALTMAAVARAAGVGNPALYPARAARPRCPTPTTSAC